VEPQQPKTSTDLHANLRVATLPFLAQDGEREHALSFATPVRGEDASPFATGEFGRHALTIVDIDGAARTVTPTNPRDSGQLITVSFEGIAQPPLFNFTT